MFVYWASIILGSFVQVGLGLPILGLGIRIPPRIIHLKTNDGPFICLLVDGVHECVRAREYRKSGNFRCKNIFVVNGGYEN